ncbi:MAG TPA: beta-ketoacyl-ACP synthase II [Bacteroidales bacterium]|nr:beta-ketoacyl-ACP synthase II [Bacteroidales bacterium]MDI9574607.1 beta-ketoacyl-ACP synthase II [Bacteroidota bacterium]OQC59524.1 MAG: 3-oxoacyl-(acyl-carrier-protein) synthase 2 [Bacteroidetes bacterium ADurb.Bin012]MBP9512117.1 beta-ketoacyl-ACP synthase II [Bacteroidales bacterium]MBP9588644.1 beta-ketoacyl-ACP synthase II [Bacteroidales bacterium]
MGLRRVVISGLGALTPIGNDVNTLWASLVDGVSGAGPITRFNAEKFKTKFACEVKGYDPLNFFDKKEVRKYDLFSQFGIVAADEAINDSGFKQGNYNPERVGVIWASGIGGIMTLTEEIRAYVTGDGTPRFSPFFIPKMISDITSGHIAIKHGFMGPNFSTVSACASSANAIVDAFNNIQRGKADIIITGGSEASISEAGIGGFNAMHALSTLNDDPRAASRPFDKDRDGFVVAEGAAALVLEDMEHALARGARIYCEIAGAGLSADAYHITSPHPEGAGAAIAMRLAIEDAKLQPSDLDHINTHGTSTPQGDIAEVKAIMKVFGEHVYNLNINSTKSMTGHLLGAAGAIEALATVLAVYYDIVPPTINHFTDDPEINPALNFTFHKAQQRTVNAAISNTFGFGGHNASILMQKFFK